jgi:DNA-binding beta-propeller fold protein YncE
MVGCATQQKPVEGPVKLVWPPAPLPTRIQFVRSIASDEDLNQDTTFSQKVIDFLAGEKAPPNHIVEPMGLAISDDGNTLYVSDITRSEVFIFDFPRKGFKRIQGAAWPVGLALDAQQNLYVVEQARKGVAVYDREGNKEIRFITDKSLIRPTGIAIDRERGKIYVADTAKNNTSDHSVKIFSLDGKLLGKIGKGKGEGPGQFMFPTYVTVDKAGNVYVADTLNCRVQMFDPDGKYVKKFGEMGDSVGMFTRPKGVALDTLGNLYVVDAGWSNVQIFNQKAQPLLFFGGRGPIPGMLKNPTAIVIDKSNNIYVADYLNHRVEQYQLVNTVVADSFEPTVTAQK